MIITLNGKSGSGKSSVAKELARRLGYKMYSAGEFWRKCAAEKGMDLSEFNKLAEKDTSFDKKADDALKKLGKTEDNLVVESRLGFLFIPKSIKIFLDASDLVRAKRTTESGRAQESSKDLDDALRKLRARDAGDRKRYLSLYKTDLFDKKHYDLVIDTSNNTVEQTTDMVYDFVMKRTRKK
jgi:CMP/dCMP kinase